MNTLKRKISHTPALIVKTVGSIFLTSLMFLSLSSNASATVIFSDGVFNNSDWSTTEFDFDTGGTVVSSQQITGGNPGEFRRISNTVKGKSDDASYSGVWAFHQSLVSTYDPPTSGSILSINYSEDAILFEGTGDGQATGAALLQNGNVYMAIGSWLVTGTDSSWHSLEALALTAADFYLIDDLGRHSTMNPDFSATGGLVGFGFYRANSTPTDIGYSNDGGIDNWMIEVNNAVEGVPEPATILLMAVGLAGLGFSRHNRKL